MDSNLLSHLSSHTSVEIHVNYYRALELIAYDMEMFVSVTHSDELHRLGGYVKINLRLFFFCSLLMKVSSIFSSYQQQY